MKYNRFKNISYGVIILLCLVCVCLLACFVPWVVLLFYPSDIQDTTLRLLIAAIIALIGLFFKNKILKLIDDVLDKIYFRLFASINNLSMKLSAKDLYSKVEICWIDDDIEYIKQKAKKIMEDLALKNVKVMNDLENMDDIEDCPLIICDYSGVGKMFNEISKESVIKEGNGAMLVRTIKKRYPEKVVIVLTSKNEFEDMNVPCDECVAKDIAFRTTDFAEHKIAPWIDRYFEPILFWRRCTHKIIENYNTEQENEIKKLFILDYETGSNCLNEVNLYDYGKEYQALIGCCKRYINYKRKLDLLKNK